MRNGKLFERLEKLHDITLDKYPELKNRLFGETIDRCIDILREECTNMVARMTGDELIDMVEKFIRKV